MGALLQSGEEVKNYCRVGKSASTIAEWGRVVELLQSGEEW